MSTSRSAKRVFGSGYYVAHKDWSDADLALLDTAFALLAATLSLVDDFFALQTTKTSSGCIKKLLGGGGGGAGHLTVKPSSATSYIGRTSPGSTTIKITTEQFVGYRSLVGTSNETCAIIDLAALLAHETSHSCLRKEKFAYLLAQFMRVKLAAISSISSSATLCCWSNLTSYDADDWKSCQSVVDDSRVRMLGMMTSTLMNCGRVGKCT